MRLRLKVFYPFYKPGLSYSTHLDKETLIILLNIMHLFVKKLLHSEHMSYIQLVSIFHYNLSLILLPNLQYYLATVAQEVERVIH